MKNAFLPIALIVVGLAWLLDHLGLWPDVTWLWIIGLVGGGIAILAIDGITKTSIVAGPLLILGGGVVFFRQEHGTSLHVLLPVLMIALGVLLLAARSPRIPDTRARSQRATRRASALPHEEER